MEQHEFRKRRSCDTQLISTLHDFATSLNNSGQVDAILLDLSKAFDKVPHVRLCHKLSNYGIRGSTLKWIQSFLSGRSQQVVLNGKVSDSCTVLSGVPQGSVLGPLLFLCYINDLPKYVKSTIRLYADDALIYREIRSKEDQDILQQDLCMLTQWANTWQMTFNAQKSVCLRITNKLSPHTYSYYMNGALIQQADHAKYLGVTIDKNLNWNEHTRQVVSKANNVRGFLQHNLKKCPPDVKASCYLMLVHPILEYACVAWSPYHQCNIQAIEWYKDMLV